MNRVLTERLVLVAVIAVGIAAFWTARSRRVYLALATDAVRENLDDVQ